MTAFTLATLRTQVMDLGDYNNSSVFTPAFVNAHINKAIGAYADMLDETWEGYRDKKGTVATVAGTETAALPADFLKARAVDILVDGKYRPLDRFQIKQSYGYEGVRGRPVGYMQVGVNLELFPTPDAIYTIRLRYVPTATVLASDSDSIDIPNGWEDFILYHALIKLDGREERSLGERMAVLDGVRASVKRAAEDRNVAEPEYIPMPGEDRDPRWFL